MTTSLSPLKSKPLRLPGQSLDEQIDYFINDKASGYLYGTECLCFLAAMEWCGYLMRLPLRRSSEAVRVYSSEVDPSSFTI